MRIEPDPLLPLLLTHARLPTLDGGADSLLLTGGKIGAVGNLAELRREAPAGTAVKDLAGAAVLPGLGDAHVHMAATGFLETALDCADITSLNDLLAQVARVARGKQAGELVLGLRLEHYDFAEGRPPSARELEAAAPDNPVYLRHRTGHSSVANERALATLDFPVGQPGVELDDEGNPTGYLIAQATQLATQRMYALNAGQVGYQSALLAAARRAAREGCTALHALDDLEAVRAILELEPGLPVRVLPYAQSFDLSAVQGLGLPRIGGCHGCALDGDFDMHTAALLEPYEGSQSEFGVLYHNDLSLQGFVLEAHRHGLQLAFHAVGDRAVEQALSAFEAAQEAFPRPDPRHRIEHAQLINPGQIARAKELGLVLSVQPAFNHAWDHQTYPQFIGERAAAVDPLATLERAALPLVGGSDSTVTELRPLLGIHAAVNHSRPEERLSVAAALRMFSYGVAYSTFHEGVRGTLAPGFDADLTVVRDDPFESAPERIKDIPVVMTVVGGRVVFEA